jgi:hypothetical protein
MRKDFKFYIGQPVEICELITRGRVVGYRLDGKNTYVNVAYWMDGKMVSVYMLEDECRGVGGSNDI